MNGNRNSLKLYLKIWRQESPKSKGGFVDYTIDNISPDCSFLEMLDQLNAKLISEGKIPVAFDNDCREGICGMCALVINGLVHGPEPLTTTCQLHMRSFKDGETVVIEPIRAKAFPVIKDLVVDRSALDRIISKGGFISVRNGSAQDANTILIPKEVSERAMDSASCIGCGACVASCKNASAMLFTGAKITHLALLPQGQPERDLRVRKMVEQMDAEGFGNCSNEYECESVCPKGIKVLNIIKMNWEYLISVFKSRV